MSLSGDIISDMQLDASIEAIGEIAGSINLDGSGTTPTITASATVSPDPGIPACNVVKTGTDEYPNFTFNFSGLKGEQGSQGIPGQDGENGSDGITPVISATASASNTTGVPSVSVTKTGTDAAPNFDFYFENLKGERGLPGPTGESGPQGPSGNDGVTPNITASGSVSNTTGVPSVTITKTGTDLAPNFDFYFENVKGERGIQGESGRNGADGSDGVTPIVSCTASADDVVGIPNVVVTRSGTDAAPNFDFAFHNIKGTQGSPGQGVPSGGATGQVLAKQSATDYDADWETLVVPSTAAEISFDNTGTGMTATDVQDAVTELKSNLTDLLNWTYIGYTTGTTKIEYPSTAKELYVEAPWVNRDYTYVYSLYILLNNNQTTEQAYRTGAYGNSGETGECVVRITRSDHKIWLASAYYNGNNATNNNGLRVWYR